MPYIFNKYYPLRSLAFFVGESYLIFSSLVLVHLLFNGMAIFIIDLSVCINQSLLVTVVFQLCLYLFDLYELRGDLTLSLTATRVTQAFGVGCIILGIIYFVLPFFTVPTKIFWVSCFLIYLLILVWRSCYYYVLQKRLFVESVVIVGNGRMAEDITREIEARADSPYRIDAFIGESEVVFNPRNVPVYENLDTLHGRFSDKSVNRIVVALDERRGKTPIDRLLDYKLNGIIIEHGVGFYERLTGKILVDKIDPSWIIYSEGFSISRLQAFIKRFFDVSIAVTLLAVTFPIMIITALIIKIETPGPILYRQTRVGKKQQVFDVIKFRSMVEDAEVNGAVWAEENDSRVTRFGKFIRKTRIDELPQLVNVLRGEMSLVGPRPERPEFVEQLDEKIPYYKIRQDIRPGITGWAQINYPYGASEEDALRKLEYDLYYMKNISVLLDIFIILRTIKTVLFAKGGR